MKSFFIFLLMSCLCFASNETEKKDQTQFEYYLQKADKEDPNAYYFLSNWYGLEDETKHNPYLNFDLAFKWAIRYFESGDCFSNASDQLLYLLNFDLNLNEKQKTSFRYMLLKMRYDEAIIKNMSKREIDFRFNLIEDTKENLNPSELIQINEKINQFKQHWKKNKKELYWCSLD